MGKVAIELGPESPRCTARNDRAASWRQIRAETSSVVQCVDIVHRKRTLLLVATTSQSGHHPLGGPIDQAALTDSTEQLSFWPRSSTVTNRISPKNADIPRRNSPRAAIPREIPAGQRVNIVPSVDVGFCQCCARIFAEGSSRYATHTARSTPNARVGPSRGWTRGKRVIHLARIIHQPLGASL